MTTDPQQLCEPGEVVALSGFTFQPRIYFAVIESKMQNWNDHAGGFSVRYIRIAVLTHSKRHLFSFDEADWLMEDEFVRTNRRLEPHELALVRMGCAHLIQGYDE